MWEKLSRKSLWVIVMWGAILIISLNSLFFVERIKVRDDCFAKYNEKITSALAAEERVYKGAYDSQNTLTHDFYNALAPSLTGPPPKTPPTQAEQDLAKKNFNELFQRHFDRLATLDKEYASIPVPTAPKC